MLTYLIFYVFVKIALMSIELREDVNATKIFLSSLIQGMHPTNVHQISFPYVCCGKLDQ